jgi:hypothetical protein
VKFSKSVYKEPSDYALQIEPGEGVAIFFHPDGPNAPAGGPGLRNALTIKSATLPNGELALNVWFNDDLLHREVTFGTYPIPLVVCRGFGARRAEFVRDEKQPWDTLVLEKVDLQAWLKPVPEEPPDD